MNSFRCPQCNLINFASAKACKRCYLNFDSQAPANHDHAGQGAQNYGGMPAGNTNYYGGGYRQNAGNYDPNQYQHNYRGNYQQPYYGPPAGLKQGMAITSFILGLLGCLPFGLIFGIIAYRKAKNLPNEYGGKAFAIAGIALSCVSVFSIGIIAAIAIPNLLAARRSANEASAIASLRTLIAAEEVYIATDGLGNCGELAQLATSKLVNGSLASGRHNGYFFSIIKAYGGCEIHAVPTEPKGSSATGTRSFMASRQDSWRVHADGNGGKPITISAPLLENTSLFPAQSQYPQTSKYGQNR